METDGEDKEEGEGREGGTGPEVKTQNNEKIDR